MRNGPLPDGCAAKRSGAQIRLLEEVLRIDDDMRERLQEEGRWRGHGQDHGARVRRLDLRDRDEVAALIGAERRIARALEREGDIRGAQPVPIVEVHALAQLEAQAPVGEGPALREARPDRAITSVLLDERLHDLVLDDPAYRGLVIHEIAEAGGLGLEMNAQASAFAGAALVGRAAHVRAADQGRRPAAVDRGRLRAPAIAGRACDEQREREPSRQEPHEGATRHRRQLSKPCGPTEASGARSASAALKNRSRALGSLGCAW